MEYYSCARPHEIEEDTRNIAADLISQAEHDVNAQSILITDYRKLINLVKLSA